MAKKTIIIISAVCAVLLIAAGSIYAIVTLTRRDVPGPEDLAYMKGDNIVIYKNEVQDGKEQYEQAGVKDAEDRIVKELLEREVLYMKAVEAGFTADEDEINATISEFRNSMEQSDDYQSFLDSLEEQGRTLDEYWEEQSVVFEKKLVINQYTDSIADDLAESRNVSRDSEEWDEVWQEYLDELVEQTVNEDKVQKTE